MLIICDDKNILPKRLRRNSIDPHTFIENGYSSDTRILLNLCRDISDMSQGYYCSLLGDCRGFSTFPKLESLYFINGENLCLAEEIKEIFDKNMISLANDDAFTIVFGLTSQKKLAVVANKIYKNHPFPLIHITKRSEKICVCINSFDKIDRIDNKILRKTIDKFYTKTKTKNIGILYDENEKNPSSDEIALKKFVVAGKNLGKNIELFTDNGNQSLSKYCAVFVRKNNSYDFIKQCEEQGVATLDKSSEILRCNNKVYLAEISQKLRICVPKTLYITKSNCDYSTITKSLGREFVLKTPNGSFGYDIFKIDNIKKFYDKCLYLLSKSELVLAQEYVYTDFDWRIGIVNCVPIFACKYFMVDKFWKIYQPTANGSLLAGNHQTLSLDQVPEAVISVSIHVANCLSRGFLGVDLKQKNGKIYLMEANLNPSVDNGVEDACSTTDVYRSILLELEAKFFRKAAEKTSL